MAFIRSTSLAIHHHNNNSVAITAMTSPIIIIYSSLVPYIYTPFLWIGILCDIIIIIAAIMDVNLHVCEHSHSKLNFPGFITICGSPR